MTTPQRILITDDSHDGRGIKRAFQELAGHIERNNDIRECILCVPAKGNIQGTTLTGVLGEKVSKLLAKNETIQYGSGSIRLETMRSLKPYNRADAILVVYADNKMMDVVDDNKYAKLIIAVPFINEDIAEWKRTWNPSTTNGNSDDDKLIQDSMVEAALIAMTKIINLGNNCLNPRDEEAVKDAFRILRTHGHNEAPNNIRAWCIRNGWPAKAADDAMKQASKVFSLRSKPNIKRTIFADDIYEKWEKYRP